MVIDTRGTHNRKGCTECRCKLFNIPKRTFTMSQRALIANCSLEIIKEDSFLVKTTYNAN